MSNKITNKITSIFPEPIYLKFEKVYNPLVLISKKHYAGYKFETINEYLSYINNKLNSTNSNNLSIYLESKGIETVRRDTCSLVSKMIETIINILFQSRCLSKVYSYIEKTINSILQGEINTKDFVIAKEVKLGTYKNISRLPPSAQIAYEKHCKDLNYFPLLGDRVGYLVVNLGDNKNIKLKDCLRSVEDFNSNIEVLNYRYYIEKLILPAINRLIENSGVNVFDWYRKIKIKNNNN